jgi:hypothetical protein
MRQPSPRRKSQFPMTQLMEEATFKPPAHRTQQETVGLLPLCPQGTILARLPSQLCLLSDISLGPGDKMPPHSYWHPTLHRLHPPSSHSRQWLRARPWARRLRRAWRPLLLGPGIMSLSCVLSRSLTCPPTCWSSAPQVVLPCRAH